MAAESPLYCCMAFFFAGGNGGPQEKRCQNHVADSLLIQSVSFTWAHLFAYR